MYLERGLSVFKISYTTVMLHSDYLSVCVLSIVTVDGFFGHNVKVYRGLYLVKRFHLVV